MSCTWSWSSFFVLLWSQSLYVLRFLLAWVSRLQPQPTSRQRMNPDITWPDRNTRWMWECLCSHRLKSEWKSKEQTGQSAPLQLIEQFSLLWQRLLFIKFSALLQLMSSSFSSKVVGPTETHAVFLECSRRCFGCMFLIRSCPTCCRQLCKLYKLY